MRWFKRWFDVFSQSFKNTLAGKEKYFWLQIWDWWIKSSDGRLPLPPPISKTHKIISCCCAVISVLVNVICVLMDGGVIVSQISRLSIFAWSTHDSRARGFTSLVTFPSLVCPLCLVSSGYSLLEIQSWTIIRWKFHQNGNCKSLLLLPTDQRKGRAWSI